MGIPVPEVPDDYGYGNDCLACYDAGKTPNYVYVRAFITSICPDCQNPPNGYLFICKQDPVNPCLYEGELEFEGETWQAYYKAHVWDGAKWISEVGIFTAAGPCDYMFHGVGEPCDQFFVNDRICGVPYSCATGGTCFVSIYTVPIIIALTSECHLVVLPGSQYERWDVGMDHSVYRIANKFDKTNLLVYIDREVIEHEWGT